MTEEKDIS